MWETKIEDLCETCYLYEAIDDLEIKNNCNSCIANIKMELGKLLLLVKKNADDYLSIIDKMKNMSVSNRCTIWNLLISCENFNLHSIIKKYATEIHDKFNNFNEIYDFNNGEIIIKKYQVLIEYLLACCNNIGIEKLNLINFSDCDKFFMKDYLEYEYNKHHTIFINTMSELKNNLSQDKNCELKKLKSIINTINLISEIDFSSVVKNSGIKCLGNINMLMKEFSTIEYCDNNHVIRMEMLSNLYSIIDKIKFSGLTNSDMKKIMTKKFFSPKVENNSSDEESDEENSYDSDDTED